MSENLHKNHHEESLENLYENSPCGYISFLTDGTIFQINKTLLHLLDYKDKKEVVQVKKIQELFRIGGKIYFETHIFPLIKIQGFVKEVNFDLLRKDGSVFPALLNVNQIAIPEQNSVLFRATVMDITDRKKYEKVLMEAKAKAEEDTRVKAEFLSTMSHEIRTPLNAIIGIGNLIQETSLDDQQKEYARILQLSSSNLLDLINNILDLSKLEANKEKLEKRNFSLSQLVEVLLHSFKLRAEEKKIKLKVEYPQNLPENLLGDPVKLNQILTNLLANALKFTKAGFVKLIIAEIERSENEIALQFTVCDSGIGIPQDKLKIIFQEFTQASYEVNMEYGGTGLGLTISQKLLQMFESSLTVVSMEGKGSEFNFNLKFKISAKVAPAKNEISHSTELLAATGARILVVDDSSINLFVISRYLKNWGLHHDTVDSGKAAIKAVKENNYDIILMDLHMPLMSGFQAAIIIRKMNMKPSPLIVAISASERGDVNLKMKRAGINHYIPKPFNPVDLQEVMLNFLNDSKTGIKI